MHKMFRIVSLIFWCAAVAADAIHLRVRSGTNTADTIAVGEATSANDGSNGGITQEWIHVNGAADVEHPPGSPRQRAQSDPSRPRRFAICDSHRCDLSIVLRLLAQSEDICKNVHAACDVVKDSLRRLEHETHERKKAEARAKKAEARSKLVSKKAEARAKKLLVMRHELAKADQRATRAELEFRALKIIMATFLSVCGLIHMMRCTLNASNSYVNI